jgi:hydrogenase maturation protease
LETVILGLGNELLGDEGVGVHAIRRLQQEKLPGSIKVIEVGTAILDALPLFEQADRIIVMDAMKSNGPPGTVYKIPLDQCSGSACIASMHGFDIFRVLALAERHEPPPVTVFGVEPQSLGWSMVLSPQVADSMPYLIEAVLKEIQQVNPVP